MHYSSIYFYFILHLHNKFTLYLYNQICAKYLYHIRMYSVKKKKNVLSSSVTIGK